MRRLRFSILAATIAGLVCAGAASAQNTISVVSGNGQVTCSSCPPPVFQFFEPLVVKVTDASGQPVAGATVNWSAAGPHFFLVSQTQIQTTSTTTGADGTTSVQLTAGFQTALESFMQSKITATAGGNTVTFTETESYNDTRRIFVFGVSPETGSDFRGVAGAQGSPVIQVHVQNNTDVVPGVSVRIASNSGAPPAMTCVTGGQDADPGSVLTDANGNANCTPLFASTPVTGQRVLVLVGGISSSPSAQGAPVGYLAPAAYGVDITAATPGLITKVSGDSQSANQGAALTNPLVAKVQDATGNANLGNVSVTWTVSPAGAATLGSGATTTSDATGQVSNTVRFASTAAGTVSITAALTNNTAIATTFTAKVNPPPVTATAMTKLSGDPQTAIVGQQFGQPLVVQVTGSNGNPLSGVAVQFTVTGGPASVTPPAAPVTGFDGKAQVAVVAGSTPGAVTITAQAGSLSQTFTLTVVPVGPRITSITNGAQFFTTDASHSALSPCGIATVFATGITPSDFQGVASGMSISPAPLPLSLMGVQIKFGNSAAPIFNVAKQNGVEQATFQVPCDVTPGNSVAITVAGNGGSTNTTAAVRAAGPGIFEWVEDPQENVARAVLLRPDGSFVTKGNPARRRDIIRMFATGLGATLPAVAGTNGLPPFGTNGTTIDALVLGQIIVGVNNAGVRVVQAKLSPDSIGVYEVDFEVPSDAPTTGDVVLSLAINATDGSATQFSGGSRIYIR